MLKPLQHSVKPGLYKHFKGNMYRVIGVSRHSETLEEYVVYEALYGDGGLWVRPAHMFTQTVSIKGTDTPRFAYISESDTNA